MLEIENGEEKWLAYPVQKDDQESQAAIGVLPAWHLLQIVKIIASYGGKINSIPINGGDAINIPFLLMKNMTLVLTKIQLSYFRCKEMEATQIRDASCFSMQNSIVFTAFNSYI